MQQLLADVACVLLSKRDVPSVFARIFSAHVKVFFNGFVYMKHGGVQCMVRVCL